MRGRARVPHVVVMALGVLLLAAACGQSSSPSATPSPSVKTGGVLRMGTTGALVSLNKFSGPNGIYAAFEFIYPALDQYDLKALAAGGSGSYFKPDFATSWQTSSDGLTWTFHTRSNAQWSDGQPLTAADAAFTLNTVVKYQNGPTANYAAAVAHLTSADAPDATTLVLHYAQPVSNVLFQMQTLGILPQHVFGPLATGDGSQLKSFPNTPGGTPVVSGGPFMITAFTPDESLVFQRNPHYYGARPLIDGFGVQEFSSSDAMVTALQSGQIDAVVGVPPTAANTLKSSGFTVSTEPGIRNNLLFLINPNPAKPNNRELLDANVRQAFEYAIDRNSIVQTAYSGFAQVGAALVPPGAAKWHDAAITPLSFDTTKANQILDQAGFAKGSDGVRMANGHPMAYQVIIQPAFARAFQIIQTDYQQIGVQLTAQSLDRAGASAAISAPNHSYQTYDLAMTTANTEPDPDFLLSAFTSLSLTSYNIAGYHDPAFEALYQKQGTTPEAQRVAVVYQMQKMLYDARTPIVLAYPNNIDAWSKKWTGFVEYGGGLFFDDSTDSLVDAHMTS